MSEERDESLWDFKQRAASADIVQVAERLGARLKRSSASERAGECPACGSGGFVIDTQNRCFVCAKSGANGDVVAMVRHVRSFGSNYEAATWIIAPPKEP